MVINFLICITLPYNPNKISNINFFLLVLYYTINFNIVFNNAQNFNLK